MLSTETSFQSPSSIDSIQEKKLIDLLKYVEKNSMFYRELFHENKININKIISLDDLHKIPVTHKENLQERNFDFLCIPESQIAEYTATSGTLGKPVIIALSENDLNRLAYNEYLSFKCAGGSGKDIYQLMVTLDRQFMAGMAYYSGLKKLGAGIIRIGPGVSALQLETIKTLKPTAIVAVPSQILKLIDYASENKFDLKESSVKKAICIGENIRNTDLQLNALGRKINDAWNIKLYSTYASTEMQTAFTECEFGKGCHHQPELIIVELLDENNIPVQPGEIGEVTITTLGVEAMPLLRYKTGDLCIAFTEPCKCGRNTLRLSPVIGRRKQLIKLKGTTIYPPALFDLLNELEEVSEYITEVFSNEYDTDEVLLHIIPSRDPILCDHKIKSALQAGLRVIPQIKYVSIEEFNSILHSQSNRKVTRFIDRRQ
jgi:phenylacetate-CoA ligase